jgi:ketosteroid isomerase-like protein
LADPTDPGSAAILAFFAAVAAGRPDDRAAVLTEDAVQRWPQSGEELHGRERILEVTRRRSSLPKVLVHRIHGAGDERAVEWSADYGDGKLYRNVSVITLRDGLIARQHDYFAESFEPPPWRADLVDLAPDPRP